MTSRPAGEFCSGLSMVERLHPIRSPKVVLPCRVGVAYSDENRICRRRAQKLPRRLGTEGRAVIGLQNQRRAFFTFASRPVWATDASRKDQRRLLLSGQALV